jgi:hypothetical protein
MSAKVGSRWPAVALACCSASLSWPATALADTVDASSTTLLIVREQQRQSGTVTVAPLYEMLSVSAREVTNPFAESLQAVFSGWGAVSIGPNKVWFDRTAPVDRVFADLDLAYVQGELVKRSVQLRLGRMLVGGGVTGALQLDGGNVVLRLPYGLGLTGYVGSPVTQRFDARGTEATFNPQRGIFATGGRASWAYVPWGEVAVSVVDITDRGDPSRLQVGGDLRATLYRPLTLFAHTNYDLHESRWAEVAVIGQYQLLPKLSVSADYRHVDPDLLLARDSIMSIFTVERHNEVGGGVQYGPWKAITIAGEYHYLKEDAADGHRVSARATWRNARGTTAGAEIGHQSLYADASGTYLNNGYFLARAFASHPIERFTATLDLQEYAFQQVVNGHTNSFIAAATAGYPLGRGFAALVSGSGGATPYFKYRFDALAKLVYDQSYHFREVRR